MMDGENYRRIKMEELCRLLGDLPRCVAKTYNIVESCPCKALYGAVIN